MKTDSGYIEWLIKGNFTEERLIDYQKPNEIINTVISAPISKTVIHQPYINANVPAKQKKLFLIDCDSMNKELIKHVLIAIEDQMASLRRC